MKLPIILLLALSSPTKNVAAFSSKNFDLSKMGNVDVSPRCTIVTSRKSVLNEDDNDCGCAPTIFAGKPSGITKGSNPRQAIRYGSIFGIDSEEVRVDDLLENKKIGSFVSIVVFLRSLG